MGLGALTPEVLRRRVEDAAQCPLGGAVGGVRALRAERDREVVEAGVDLVELQRRRGALLAQHRVVGHHRAALVDRGELDEAVADDRGRHEDGLGVLGHLVLGVVADLDDHLGAGGLDGVHRADVHAEDPDVGAVVERHGARELRGDVLLLVARHEEQEAAHHQRHHEDGAEGLGDVRSRHGHHTGGMFWM